MTRLSRLDPIVLWVAAVFAAACEKKDAGAVARDALASQLRDSIGATADPQVSLFSGGPSPERHLYIQLDTAAFANQSEPQFADHAGDVARFATRHYDVSRPIDSITVASRSPMGPGIWKIYHSRTFSTRELGGR